MTEENGSDENEVDWSQLEDMATDPDGGAIPSLITPDMLAKRMLWDLAPCDIAIEVSKYIGLPATSEEVEAMNHSESHERLDAVTQIAPVLHDMSLHATRAIVGTMILANQENGEKLLDEEERAALNEKTHPLILSAAVAIIAELIDVGLLHFPHYQFVTFNTEDFEGPKQ